MNRQSSHLFVAIVAIAVCAVAMSGQARGIEPSAKSAARAQSLRSEPARRESPRRAPMLVPPPPPTIPASTMLTFMSPLPLEMLSESDLKKQRQETAGEIQRARDSERREEEGFRERKGRSELFVSLYKEGVVSRRELEVAQRDASKSEIDLTDARLKVTDLERDMKKIETRLQDLSKQNALKGRASEKRSKKAGHK